ncbi:hypothetical protein CCM_02171 [Cordyceps militaris CM01]|uniref:Uncharacterized protein n=1 Tax=Cordyceps militaris (strain CM01) TaxID=983644 RepID=G3J859_CORMM|nr:uncharacterized protein CCM_02171 [Cordyceps militaris CM01]EGX93901.1 hypothetical protein CCM_02171 [Cordyceps militaris CM01]
MAVATAVCGTDKARTMKWYPRDENLRMVLAGVKPCVADFTTALETEERVKERAAELTAELAALYGPRKKGKRQDSKAQETGSTNTEQQGPKIVREIKQVKLVIHTQTRDGSEKETKIMLSDRDPKFMAVLWQHVWKRMHTKLIHTTAYRPPRQAIHPTYRGTRRLRSYPGLVD